MGAEADQGGERATAGVARRLHDARVSMSNPTLRRGESDPPERRFVCDANGNQLSDGITSNTYDLADRMASPTGWPRRPWTRPRRRTPIPAPDYA